MKSLTGRSGEGMAGLSRVSVPGAWVGVVRRVRLVVLPDLVPPPALFSPQPCALSSEARQEGGQSPALIPLALAKFPGDCWAGRCSQGSTTEELGAQAGMLGLKPPSLVLPLYRTTAHQHQCPSLRVCPSPSRQCSWFLWVLSSWEAATSGMRGTVILSKAMALILGFIY